MTRTVRAAPFATQNELIDPIVAQAGRVPSAPALRCGGVELSYAEVLGRIAQVGGALDELGVGPGDLCALSSERTPETLVLLLAIVARGAAYLPLDRDQPDARLAAMLADARPQIAIVDRALHARLPPGVAWSDWPSPAAPRRELAVQPSGALAYVLFTSGSTGRPKGVAMQTAAVAALIDWHRAHRRLGQPARTLQFAPLGFDVSFQEIFSTLATGGTLVLPGDAERRDPWRLLEFIERERIERLFAPFVALQALAEAALDAESGASSLRDVLTAGERLRITPALRAFFAARRGCVLHNHYGPTETHVVTAHELDGDPARWPELPPIGKPLPHVRVRLEAGDGGDSELLLGGGCLAAGYVGQPQLTAERFVDRGGARWYCSGDAVRRLPGGELDYRGRLDDQVKVDGRRIEPAEVEAALCRHAAVAEAAVVVRRHGVGTHLLANVVLRDAMCDTAHIQAELGKYCASVLPNYMVPASFAFHAVLPVTASGKVDRRALQEPAARGAIVWDDAAPLERQLVALWRQLLGVESVTVAANVFDLGARSLTVVEALTELRRRGHVLSVAQVYENPSAAAQALLLRAHHDAPAAPADDRARRAREAFARFARPHAAA
jgi:amino acid adenylation domain-containing protein